MVKNNFFSNILKGTNEEFSVEVEREPEFIDTGSYAFNALISANIYGGFVRDKITAFAGETQTGKTFFAASAVKNFLQKHENGVCIYWDTEGAIDENFLENRGIDSERVIIRRPETIEAAKQDMAIIIDNIKKLEPEKRKDTIFVFDSLGNIASTKEKEDALEKNDKADMTRAKQIKSLFRIVASDLNKLNIPFLVTNHIYYSPSPYGDPRQMGGGEGLKFNASTICMISRAMDKDDGDVVGVILNIKTFKSRHSKPYQNVYVKLNFEKGVDRYYGLLELAEKYEIIKKVGRQYELSDGSKVFGSVINNDPEKYFTKDILDKINERVKKDFGLGE